MLRLLPLLLLGLCGCGPSLRMLHESSVYFERCHSAEYDDSIPADQKAECWNRWLRWYASSQTQTRVLYAEERVVYLMQGELIDPLPVASSAAAESSLPSAGGTAPVVPGPNRSQPLLPRTTGNPACEPACRPGWDVCSSRCDVDQRACLSACQNQYAACMAGCIG